MDEAQFKALSLAQRKAHQERLQSLGLYAGSIDGDWGSGTKAAFDGEKKRLAEDAERARKGKIEEQSAAADAELKSATAKGKLAEAAESERKTIARKERADTAASGLGMLAQTLAGAPAALGGVWAGREMGKGINYYMDESQKNKNAKLRGLAEDRRAGLTSPRGAQAAARVSGVMPSESSILRVGGRTLPHLALGGFMGGKGAMMLAQEDPDGPFYPDIVNRAAGLGMIGAGTGIAERGILYGVAPGEAADAQAIAVIQSDQLRRGKSQTPKGGTLTARQMLVEEAKAAGVKNIAKKNMTQLQDALKKLPKAGPMAIPAAAGTLAYMATPSDANASTDGASVTGNDRALTNAAGGAGAGYGMSRLMDTLKRNAPNAMRAVGSGLTMATPGAAVDMTDVDQENLNMARNSAARYLPEFVQGGAIGEARDMAQVPTPNPERMSMGPRIEEPGPADAEFDALVAAAEQDPEIAAMIQQMIQERMGAQPGGAPLLD